MKQVLLAGTRPITMWMGDNVALGDTFAWKNEVFVVSSIYGTHVPSWGAEVRKTDRPHHNTQACVVLDHHGDSN